MHAPRPGTRLLALVLLFAVSFAAGLAVVLRRAPDALRSRVEAALTEAFGTPVAIGDARLAFDGSLRIVVDRIEARWADPAVRLEAPQLEVRLDPTALLSGTRRVRAAVLTRPEISTTTDAAVRAEPAAWLPLLLGLRVAGALELRDARVRLPAPAGSVLPELRLEGVNARLADRSLHGGAALIGRGAIALAGRDTASFEIDAERGPDGSSRVALALTGAPLGTLVALAGWKGVEAEGHLSGVVSLELDPTLDAARLPARIDLDLLVDDLQARGPLLASLGSLRTPRCGVRATLARDGAWLRLRDATLATPVAAVALEGAVELPLREDSRAWLSAQTAELRGSALPARLLARASDLGIDGAAATFREVELFASGRAARLPQLLTSLPRGPGERDATAREIEASTAPQESLRVAARFEGANLRLPGEHRLDALRGEVSWSGDRVLLRGLRGKLDGGEPLRLDLAIDGVDQALAAEPGDATRARDPGPLPALASLVDWIREVTARSRTRPRVIDVEADRLEHPVLAFPVSALRGRIEPRPNGLHAEISQASWAGLSLRGVADFESGPERALSVRAHVTRGAAGPQRATAGRAGPAESWLVARLRVTPLRLGGFELSELATGLEAYGDDLALAPLAGKLGQGGRLSGRVDVDLSAEGAARYAADLRARAADLSGVVAWLGLDPASASGRIDLAGHFDGRLAPGEPFVASLVGDLSGRSGEGVLHSGLRLVESVRSANAGEGGVAEARDTADPVDIRSLEGDLRFERGTLHIASLSLEGSTARMIAAGEVDLRSRPHALRGVLGMFLFRNLDRVLEKLPIVNGFLLGEDGNLFGSYFAMSGTWEEPVAERVPGRSLVATPADFVLRDVPGFVLSGVRAIQGALARSVGAGTDRLGRAPEGL